MKPTENLEQLLERFTKRIAQIEIEADGPVREAYLHPTEHLHYLRGCKDTVVYLMTGKLPNDGNHDGMKNHKPVRHNDLGSLD